MKARSARGYQAKTRVVVVTTRETSHCLQRRGGGGKDRLLSKSAHDDDDDDEDVYRLKICQKRHIVISSQCFPSVCSIKCIITPEFINMNEREQYHL